MPREQWAFLLDPLMEAMRGYDFNGRSLDVRENVAFQGKGEQTRFVHDRYPGQGCAIALERAFLPPHYEADLPQDPEEAAAFVSRHPNKTDVRVVVGVLRTGERHGLARLVSNPEDLLGAEDLVPGLAEALVDTFRSDA